MLKPWHIGFGVFIGLYAFRKLIMENIWDAITAQRIKTLHPKFRPVVIKFIQDAEKAGMKLRVTAAYRTCQEQNELYAQGRTKPGNIVTNARCNESMHNFGLAIDVVEIKDGKALWVNPNWTKIGQLGKSLGMVWGGDFAPISDKPHFEMTFGNKLAVLQKLSKENGFPVLS